MVVKTKAGVLRGLWLWSLRLSDVLTEVRVSTSKAHYAVNCTSCYRSSFEFCKDSSKGGVHSISKADYKTRQRTSTENWLNSVDSSPHGDVSITMTLCFRRFAALLELTAPSSVLVRMRYTFTIPYTVALLHTLIGMCNLKYPCACDVVMTVFHVRHNLR